MFFIFSGKVGLINAGLNQRDIDTYVLAKHGLERNDYMRMKGLRTYIENLEGDIKEDMLSIIDGKTFSEYANQRLNKERI